MNLWDDPRFSKPTDEVGDWRDVRTALFAHEGRPTAVKYAVEKLTGQLLHREPTDIGHPVLRYSGTSGAGGHPRTVRLELVAVMRTSPEPKFLYRLTSERSAPKRWEDEHRFVAACERAFAHWCGHLQTMESEASWAVAGQPSLADTVIETIAAEDAAARMIEDPAPIAAVQRQVLEGLRAGLGFFTAHKEGGSHLFFDGNVYRRNDHGDEPNISEVHADDAAMLACLRSFYDWDSQRDSFPHPKPELAVWNYILGQLRSR